TGEGEQKAGGGEEEAAASASRRKTMPLAIWLLGLVCHLAGLAWSLHMHRLHPKQESFVRQLSTYEIVTPVRVNDFGELFPQQLHYRRRRRSADSDSDLAAARRAHYRVEAFGERFHLNLSADAAFIAPSYAVTHLGEPDSRGHDPEDMRHCFFQGHVNGQRRHRAVFSLCTGLFLLHGWLFAQIKIGTFTTHSGEYFLEPLMTADEEEYEEEHNKPHLVYKHERKNRQDSDASEPCASSGNDQKQMQWNLESIPQDLGHKEGDTEDGMPTVSVIAKESRNLVAAVYKDPSVGNLINIMIVKLIIIHNEQEGPNVNRYAAATLHNFCVWQQSQNVLDDSHPSHHDTALLITREDICREKDKCDTLGLAELGTMCDPYRSCSISEENGLSSSFTIAHELGHVFNMPHDNHPKCREAGMKHQYHVMAPTLNYDTSPWSWSKCSQKYITEFLDTGYGECLLDEPVGRSYDLPVKLPGQIYNANRQCELMFGPGSQVCPFMRQCKRLWCTSAEGDHKGCRTQHMPLADGTECGYGMVGCELEEKERFWSELDEVMESIPTGERVVIGVDFNGHVGEVNTGDEEVMGKFGVKERNLEGQMVVDFAKRMDMAVVNTYFQKREEHRVTYKSGEFRQKLRQALGGQVVLPDDWETTAEVIRETGRKVLGVSSGRRKEDKETWWWNEEVQDSIQKKRLAKKKWDMDKTEENRQEYKELQRRVKREVSKAKQKAYDELYTRLDTREGQKDLYRLVRQRDGDGKDVQQVRVIKDRDGGVHTSEESVQRRWKEYFEELMNEENKREKRVEGVNSVEQKVDKIRKDEVRKALKRMKSGKAVGPDDIPVEVWKCLGEAAVEFLTSLFNRVLESERMPEEWRRSVLVLIFKNKGDVQSCSNYRGIKLMSHTMKLWERVVEARLRKVVEICEQQYGFMPRKSTTDAIFALRILMEKYRDGQRELHCVFVDLEKAYDRVPREELWYCMRKSGVAEKYVRLVQDMYERSRTVVRCVVGQTEEFKVEVGLHQGSALSPFLFAMVMDQLSEEVRQESPWTMMFADDIVICSESREQVEENLERWRCALERRGMKVSRSKTEHVCVNEREGSGTVRLQDEEVKKVQEFKYLGSTVHSNGECGNEVKKRVQAGWNGWRKVSGVLCDRKISARIKGKVYRTVVRAAMLYGLVSLRKRQESELEVAELNMLRFSFGGTRLDRIRNEYITGTAHVGRLGDKVREARLRWFGHVQRKERDVCATAMPAFVKVVGLCWGNLVRQTPCCPALKEAHRQRYLTALDSVTAHEKASMFTQIVLAGIHCRHGMCVNREIEARPVHGEWGPWGPYSMCSRTCGGGTRSTSRDCNRPEPRNGGRFCVGRRMKFRSCNTEPCPRGRRDFREEQCSQFDGKHFNISGLPSTVRWVPKYSGILMKDQCKLFCRVAGTMSYYQLQDRVVDGTPCGPDTYDICVQGLCRQAGCDHVLNSKARNDKCGVCGGDNSSCRTVAGTFNNAQYGYNVVVRIPAGATNIDIRQVSYSGTPEDDNYLALSDSQSNFLVNGNFVVSMFKREISFKGTQIEYSGSNTTEERVNCTERVEEELILQVLCVGNLYSPDVRYSFNIPIEEHQEQFVWDPSGPWQECSRMCQGERRRKPVCARKSDRLVVSDQRCEHLPRPRGVLESCNIDCELRWHVGGKSECSTKCGPGYRTLEVICMRYSRVKRESERVESRACADLTKPQSRELCHGDCLLKSWQYSAWSQCSKSCGRGTRTRDSYCMNNLGHRLAERECSEYQRAVSEPCNDTPCPDWSISEWTECTVTCAKGVRRRQVFCVLAEERLSDELCDSNSKPRTISSCVHSECASWQVGAWSTCAVTCGHGYQMRAVRCVSGAYGKTMDDRECNAASRPRDSQECDLSACPHTSLALSTPRPAASGHLHIQWRFGSWTTCSVSCGKGEKARYVSCRDSQGRIADEAYCAHLPRPPETSVCFSPCGQWREGEWSPCSVSCGVGHAKRQVVCMNYNQQVDESFCHLDEKPSSEQECAAAPCHSAYQLWPNNQPYFPPDPRSHPGHSSWNVPSADHQWRTGPWGSCSSTCEGGFQRRVVVCQDSEGRSTNYCDERVKPSESKSCDSGPCPLWNYGSWGECSLLCGGGQRTRLVVCQRPNGQRLNEHNCDMLDKPPDVERCNMQPCPGSASWHRRPWKPVR
ncbi:hypothetical protein QTP86_028719, partial [Hemibagrus guttatus]